MLTSDYIFICITGPRGSGRTTQAKILAERTGFALISFEATMISLAKKSNNVSDLDQLKKLLARANPPAEIVVKILTNRIRQEFGSDRKSSSISGKSRGSEQSLRARQRRASTYKLKQLSDPKKKIAILDGFPTDAFSYELFISDIGPIAAIIFIDGVVFSTKNPQGKRVETNEHRISPLWAKAYASRGHICATVDCFPESEKSGLPAEKVAEKVWSVISNSKFHANDKEEAPSLTATSGKVAPWEA